MVAGICQIHVGDDLVKNKKTTIKNKTLNPTWMENFEFHIQSTQRRDILNVQAFDKDLIGTDDSLGSFGIALDTLVPGQEYREWHHFDKDEDAKEPVKNDGQIELTYILKEIVEQEQDKSSSPEDKKVVGRTSSKPKTQQFKLRMFRRRFR